MNVLKIKKRYAEEAKKFLAKNDFLDYKRKFGRTQNYLLFPLSEKSNLEKIKKKFPNSSFETRRLEPRIKKSKKLKILLKDIIPKDKLDLLIKSYDTIGDIAVIQIPPELENFEKTIAWTIRRTRPNIKVVLKKATPVKGKYRLRKVKVITGEKRTSTTYLESGVRMQLDVAKTYFSPRLGTERLRISNQVKPKENILVLFAGVGPYALVIAKKHPSSKITAIELNPDAYKYMVKNIKLNKLTKKIKPIKGDVSKVLPKLKLKFDRIIMVLPESAIDYLDLALKKAKENTIIHLYTFQYASKIKQTHKKIKSIAPNIKILKSVKAGQFKKDYYRFCIDLKVLKKS